MTALTTTVTDYSHEFLAALSGFALAYRNHGAHGYDHAGDWQRLRKIWIAEAVHGDSNPLSDDALRLCRHLAAQGKHAFDV